MQFYAFAVSTKKGIMIGNMYTTTEYGEWVIRVKKD